MDIIKKSQTTPEDIVIDILKKWLQGTGMPVTWQSLITSLENLSYHMLASTIKEELDEGKVRVYTCTYKVNHFCRIYTLIYGTAATKNTKRLLTPKIDVSPCTDAYKT